MANPNQKAAAGQQWDEAEIEQALRRLAEATFSALQETTKSAYSEIKEYKQTATNEETAKVLEHAKQSRKDNPKGIKPWRARDDPDWLTTNG
ncbi:hypothetical protein SLS63_003207 [Diaporthe eres]|uniref:Uncharacterized protein n=1 Tax=Diaporthe eres TaxID=83184 RepID=A0ABR1PHD6_DIAER